MKQTLIRILLILSLTVLPAGILSSPAFADCSGAGDDAQGQVLQGISQSGSDCTDGGVTNAISAAVKILSYVVGVAAIIMIILSGFRYVTSGGDSARIASAKNTLIYAIVGIVVAALAQVLVHFALGQSVTAATSCSTGQHLDTSSNKCVNN